jgi:putative chitinase
MLKEVVGAKFAEGVEMLDKQQMLQVMPYVPHDKVDLYLDCLNKAMVEAKIDSKLRAAAFLAQLSHESCGLKYFEEIASGEAYEGRKDLGNVYPGDGKKFKGREGPIQLTGRSNYSKAGSALGLDLEGNPELAATPEVGFRVACWYWTTHNLNALADKGPVAFDTITKVINGGLNGKADRDRLYAIATKVLT